MTALTRRHGPISILILQNPETAAAAVDVEEIASARMDGDGNLLVATGGIHLAIRGPMVQPLQDGESVWRFVERCAAAAASAEEGLDILSKAPDVHPDEGDEL